MDRQLIRISDQDLGDHGLKLVRFLKRDVPLKLEVDARVQDRLSAAAHAVAQDGHKLLYNIRQDGPAEKHVPSVDAALAEGRGEAHEERPIAAHHRRAAAW